MKTCLFCVCTLGWILASGLYSISKVILIKAYLTIISALSLTSLGEREICWDKAITSVHGILASGTAGRRAKICFNFLFLFLYALTVPAFSPFPCLHLAPSFPLPKPIPSCCLRPWIAHTYSLWDTTSHLPEWLSSINQQTTSVGEDTEKTEPLCIVDGNAYGCSHNGKQYGVTSTN